MPAVSSCGGRYSAAAGAICKLVMLCSVLGRWGLATTPDAAAAAAGNLPWTRVGGASPLAAHMLL